MKLTIVIAIGLLFTISVGFSQTPAPQTPVGADANLNIGQLTSNGMFRSFDNRYQGVVGQPTLFPKIVGGKVTLAGGTTATDQMINYDVMSDELLVESKKLSAIMVVKKEMVDSFIFNKNDSTNERKFIKIVAEPKSGYYEVLYEGKTSLYKKYFKTVEKANYGGGYNANAKKYDEFVGYQKYYLKKEGVLEEVKLTKKSLESKLEDKKSVIEAYIKSNGPNLKKEGDVVQLLQFVDAQ